MRESANKGSLGLASAIAVLLVSTTPTVAAGQPPTRNCLTEREPPTMEPLRPVGW